MEDTADAFYGIGLNDITGNGAGAGGATHAPQTIFMERRGDK